MLQLNIPPQELYDEEENLFIELKGQTLQLEHSLVSISKWESNWLKPFLSKDKKTSEEILDYVRCMTINSNVDSNIYNFIDNSMMEKISSYIENPMTATTFPPDKTSTTNREIVTSELIYYWMIAFNIPFECQKWHLSRLLVLINICNFKNQPKKKMSKSEILRRNKDINAARRAALGSRG